MQTAADANRRPDDGDLADGLDVVPDVGRQASGAVAERQAQVPAAVALGAQLHLADEQHAFDLGALLQLSNEHGNTVASVADRPRAGVVSGARVPSTAAPERRPAPGAARPA